MKQNAKQQLIISEDGSHTLFVPELNEHYHSVHGAIQESEHVYIGMGLNHLQMTDIRILEIGFGTGLNALLTQIHGQGKTIRYQTVEKYPVDEQLARQINYGKTLNCESVFTRIHSCNWNYWEEVTPDFSILKWQGDFRHITPEGHIDLVYFDAFGPDKHPDLWSEAVFTKLYDLMNPNGVLVTYCAKGSVRRILSSCGFCVERIPGPPHKREMVRATKK